MRYAPAALALSLLAAVTASVSFGAPTATLLDARAAALLAQGRAALGAGNTDAAIDAFEAALTVQPGQVAIYLDLAEATRRQGLQGKALHYYREALEREPNNPLAIAGEGTTLVEKGAIEKARLNLVRLKQLCGGDCAPSRQLAEAIRNGPARRIVTAEAVQAKPVVTPN